MRARVEEVEVLGWNKSLPTMILFPLSIHLSWLRDENCKETVTTEGYTVSKFILRCSSTSVLSAWLIFIFLSEKTQKEKNKIAL